MAQQKSNLNILIIAIVAIVAIFALMQLRVSKNIGGEAFRLTANDQRPITLPRGILTTVDGQKFCCEAKCASAWPRAEWQSCAKSCMGSLCTLESPQVMRAAAMQGKSGNMVGSLGSGIDSGIDTVGGGIVEGGSRNCNCWKGSTLTSITCDWGKTCSECCVNQGGGGGDLPKDCLASGARCSGSLGTSCCSGDCYAGICA